MRAKKWLPDLDSNQDKLNQNQLCYRYTIGQNVCQYTRVSEKIKPGIEKKTKKTSKPGILLDKSCFSCYINRLRRCIPAGAGMQGVFLMQKT